MQLKRVALLCAGAVLIGACDDNGDVIVAPKVPLAFVRFVNAVPDTLPTDWRFIDQIEHSPVFFTMRFRDFSPYQGADAGSRHLRIFPSSTDINVTQQFLIDTTLTLAEGTYYTLVHVGFARPGQTPADRLLVIQDEVPTPGASNIAVRAVNLATGMGALDFFLTKGGAAPAAPTFGAVAYLTATTYGTTVPGAFSMRVTNAGQAAPVLVDATAPAGDPGNAAANADPIGGSTLGGSVISVFMFPRSVAGSAAPQTTAFTTPFALYMIDRNPPR